MRVKKETVDDIKYIVFGIIAAILINKLLGLVLATDLPVVAVVSESMMHDRTTKNVHYHFLDSKFGYSRETIDSWPLSGGFRKGDVLVVRGIEAEDVEVGDVIVYNIIGQPIPIVHRVVDIDDGEFSTKGDHNSGIDPWEIQRIRGEAFIRVPLLGWPKVILNMFIGALT